MIELCMLRHDWVLSALLLANGWWQLVLTHAFWLSMWLLCGAYMHAISVCKILVSLLSLIVPPRQPQPLRYSHTIMLIIKYKIKIDWNIHIYIKNHLPSFSDALKRVDKPQNNNQLLLLMALLHPLLFSTSQAVMMHAAWCNHFHHILHHVLSFFERHDCFYANFRVPSLASYFHSFSW